MGSCSRHSGTGGQETESEGLQLVEWMKASEEPDVNSEAKEDPARLQLVLGLGVQLTQALNVPGAVGEGPKPVQPSTPATLCVLS